MSTALFGTIVNLPVDYSLPFAIIRNHLYVRLKNHELWDGKVWHLHATSVGEKSVELRALMSTANSVHAWELRCHVREELLGFLQKNDPRRT